jgi:YidC/Oxa1 family membrane protein insertase
MNMDNNKPTTQKRILFATLLAFAFFIAYDFLYIQPMQQQKIEAEKAQGTAQTTATSANVQNDAPQTQTQSANFNTAPTSNEPIIATIKTAKNLIEIDSLGRISQVTLSQTQYVSEAGKQLKLFNPNNLKPLEVRFSDRNINTEAFNTPVVADLSEIDASKQPQTITLTQELTDTTLTKVITFNPNGSYEISVSTTNSKDFFITPGFRPDILADMYADHGVLLKNNDNTLTIVEDGDLSSISNFVGIKIASAFDRYYATVLYNFERSMALSLMPDNAGNPQIFINAGDSTKLYGYMGPKEYETLKALNPELTDVIEYGWFTFIAKPMFTMLNYIFSLVGHWGWTIVITTILIKLVLYPLAHKGMVSMMKLKDLAPKIKEVQEKYKGDNQKASMHMMELYKKHGANPMGGCLPILLQIPVFFAIYRVLINAIELKGADFLWVTDLAEMDPYFILPILMGATMYLQQKITPNAIQDEMQRKIFQYLPVIFTFFFLWFPAGLTLYWFVNNVFTVLHQYYLNRTYEKAKELRKAAHEKI